MQERDHLLVNEAVGRRQHAARFTIERRAVHLGGAAARRFDDGGAGHQIPRMQRPFPVGVQPAAGDEAQVQRRRAQAARSLRGGDERRPFGQIVLQLGCACRETP